MQYCNLGGESNSVERPSSRTFCCEGVFVLSVTNALPSFESFPVISPLLL